VEDSDSSDDEKMIDNSQKIICASNVIISMRSSNKKWPEYETTAKIIGFGDTMRHDICHVDHAIRTMLTTHVEAACPLWSPSNRTQSPDADYSTLVSKGGIMKWR